MSACRNDVGSLWPQRDLLDEALVFEQRHVLAQRLLRDALDQAVPERATAHGCWLQHAPRALGQAIETRLDDLVHRGWHTRVLPWRGRDATVLLNQRARVVQIAHDLFNKERIATRSRRESCRPERRRPAR